MELKIRFMQPVTTSHSVVLMPLEIANKCVSGAKKSNPKQVKISLPQHLP